MSISRDERRLFRTTAGTVKPLRQDHARPQRSTRAPVPEQRQRDDRETLAELLAPLGADADTGENVVYGRPGVQQRVIRRLRRGDYMIQGAVDLHGHTVPEARTRLVDFLAEARRRQLRCVRIVHGKGLRSLGGRGVLKSRVVTWLAHRDDVLAFCSAPNHDGGTGAVYVLLRRR